MRLVFACLLTVSAIAAPPDKTDWGRFEYTQTEMAATVKIVLYAPGETTARQAAEAAFSRIRDLNSVLSDYDPQSELSRLGRAGSEGEGVQVSADLWQVLTRAEEIARASRGAFDITVKPVVRLWRRARQLHSLPSPERLKQALALVDYRLVQRDPLRGTVKLLKRGLQLDLGGIAKGYAASEALEVLKRRGISSALVDLGGDIALGSPPPGRTGWIIRVSPRGETSPGGRTLCLSRVAVATSGDAEQFLLADGQRYSHIIDPRTGMGLTDHSSVTVVAPDGMTADALASAVSVLGPGEGIQLIDSTPGSAGRVVQCSDGKSAGYESNRWKNLQWVEPSVPPPPPAGQLCVAEETPAKEDSPDAKGSDPTVTPPVTWMLEPLPLADSKAENAGQMKAYTEKIPGTDLSFDMVPIAGGKFLMGSPPAEANREDCEGPQVTVELEPFWMGKCEVRWEEYELWGLGYDAQRRQETKKEDTAWDRLADAITCPTKPYSDMTFGMGREGYPAICMTHLAARVYCKWLSAKTGRYYRLPTEAEWEYAARAGTTTAYSFGDGPKSLGDYAWYFDNSEDMYHKVGQKKPNPWGLFDMHGNVAEWVLGQYTPEGYKQLAGKPQRNPLIVPADLYPRVVRGGSWMDDPEMLRSASRRGSNNDWKMGDPQIPQSIWYHTEAVFVGFRVVRPLKAPDEKQALRFDVDAAQKATLADYLEFLAGRQ